MTGGGNAAQGVYAPIPQIISDTDSEEDLHTTPMQTTKLPANPLNGHYHPMEDPDEYNSINGFPGITLQDDIPIIKSRKSMSPLRKVLFVISILVCFFTIFIFLWVIPCDENLTCPAVVRNDGTSNWEKTYHGIELKNAINVVRGVGGRSKNLIFLFRGDIMNLDPVQEFPYIPSKGGGLISIVGSSGKVAWFTRLNRVPSDIDCSIIDIDNNGDNDCIVTGEGGLMEAINPTTGTVTWHLTKLSGVSFPILLPDIDNDGIYDLATSCSINNGNHNEIILISGQTGTIIGEPLIVEDCKTIHKIAIDKNQLVSYICQNVTFKESYIDLEELYRRITNRSIDLSRKVSPLNQHLIYGQRRDTHSQRNIYAVHNRKLIVQNEGRCPNNCNVTVQLIDLQSGE